MSSGDGRSKSLPKPPPDADRPVTAVADAAPSAGVAQAKQQGPRVEPPEVDEFGLPVKPPRRRQVSPVRATPLPEANGDNAKESDSEDFHEAPEQPGGAETSAVAPASSSSVAAEKSDPAATPPMTPTNANTTEQRPRAATLDDIADREPRVSDSPRKSKEIRPGSSGHARTQSSKNVSEWSHQVLAPKDVAEEGEGGATEEEWQAMPSYATHRIFDDWGKVLAKSYDEEEDDQQMGYSSLGGAGKGYTRVQADEDAQSATSMDDDTAYLFKAPHASNALDEDDEGRDVVSQMQTTKELLTEGQRIAYVGLVRLAIQKILERHLEIPEPKAKSTRKQIDYAMEALKMWGQKMMVRLYSHMEIDSAEQMMVEQLGEHGVLPSDLTPALMQNARVRNPATKGKEGEGEGDEKGSSVELPRPSSISSPRPSTSSSAVSVPSTPAKSASPPPPAYEDHTAHDLTAQNLDTIEDDRDLDLDIRWTILCDLFLLLLAGGAYDARSRVLLERVADALAVSWQEVCRFEKRVTDAIEMQEQADQEKWNEDEHLEARRREARKKRLMVMGLCTVGGGLVIGLSAGLLAPVIGAGLAAGFTTFGVAGTGTFLGGAGAAAMIGGGGALTGGIIGVRAGDRRTGAVRTFEYRPLFNNKRPNLIVTVAGWMTGRVDDVRLPFSTVDPIMGDIYSVHWEPEMLQSTGQTIQILATEALTQTIQQILGATILTGLMAGLSVPVMLTKLSYLIDNPWTVSLARADAAGLILADSLIDRNLGVRPITLVGFSLGSRLIFSCLKELARRGALGIIQNVYLFGSPIVAKRDEYISARTVVAGRFVNGYATNDWILGYLFRATSGGIMRVSGLNAIDVPGVEDKDCTELVPGHMAYRTKMPILLEEVGWLVESREFSEIEDPDPDNHKKRQRELINEIEAARLELDEKEKGKKEKGGIMGFFSRRKQAAQRKEWEMYDERSLKVLEGDEKEAERVAEEGKDVMFDVDAIRQEALKLALQGGDVEEIKRHLVIKEIESTLPALRVSQEGEAGAVNGGDGGALRQTKSYNDGIHTTTASLTNGETVVTETEVPRPVTAIAVKDVKDSRGDSNSISDAASVSHSPALPTPSETSAPERPPLRTAVTAPAPELRHPEENPWGEEEEFGAEREVRMDFE